MIIVLSWEAILGLVEGRCFCASAPATVPGLSHPTVGLGFRTPGRPDKSTVTRAPLPTVLRRSALFALLYFLFYYNESGSPIISGNRDACAVLGWIETLTCGAPLVSTIFTLVALAIIPAPFLIDRAVAFTHAITPFFEEFFLQIEYKLLRGALASPVRV